MKKILIFTLFLSAAVAMQIKSIEFKGLIHLSPEMAKEISGLQTGQEFSFAQGDRAVKKLFAQGYFQDVWIEEDNGNIIVNVKEKPTIAVVDIVGVGDDDEKNIKSILSLNKGMVYDDNSIKRAKKQIVSYFETKGYFDTIVEERTEKLDESSSLKLVLDVNRGENIIIKDIRLSGAKNLDYDDIEPVVANKQREALGWFWGFNSGKFIPAALPTDAARIKDEYLTRGYLDANVSEPYMRLYYDTYNANINYDIEEGEKYKIGKLFITIPGNQISKDEFRDSLNLQEGDTFNVKKLRKDIAQMETKLADQGYAFAKVFPQTQQNTKEHIININYNIIPGNKVYIGKVIIGGNARTEDRVIRRDVFLGSGELYNRTSLIESQNALRRTGYFDEVSMKERQVSDNTVDIYVDVKESPTGSIRGGVGYGSSQGFIFDVGLSDKNIFGTGLQGSVSVSRSDNELFGNIGLTNPRVFDSPYSLGANLYAKKNDWSSYNEKVQGGSLIAGRRLGRYTHVSLKYVLEKTKLSDLAQSLLDMGYENGTTIKSALTPMVVFNNTDDYYLPRQGLIASSSLEYANLGGDEKFLKSISKLKLFYGLEDLIGYDIILRYKARLRLARDDGYLPINERLYLGGIGSVRGYNSRSIGPRNKKGYTFGGKRSFNNSVEASFPLIDRIRMRGAFFYDYGMLGIEKFDEFKRSSVGFAVEWLSPIGAVSLIFSKPIKPEDKDETSSFEFSVGRQF